MGGHALGEVAARTALDAPAAPRPGVPLPPANILTRALGAGMPGPPEPDVACAPALAGDRLALCSDGVHGVVEEDLLCRIVWEAPDPQSAADALVVEAVQAAPGLPDGQRPAEGRPVGGIGGEPGCSPIPPAPRA
jgi:serine/threonine protein phosphatase PrpC